MRGAGKGFVQVQKVKEYIRRFHEFDIVVDSAMVFGFDEHDATIFERALDFINEIELDVPHSVILISFPGTRLFTRFEREGRLLTRDWSKYDGAHVVFQPKQMIPQQLEEGATWFWYRAKRSKRAQKLLWSVYWG